MRFNKESAVERAKKDLADRLDISESKIEVADTTETDFPNMSLGAPEKDEMSAQMISTGWKINLQFGDKNYEYRADKYQLRLFDYKGNNFVIEPQ
ncbi:MAG: hypothetical protein ABIP06_07045 [Pyrinomonadaceae bacterium]